LFEEADARASLKLQHSAGFLLRADEVRDIIAYLKLA